MVKVNWRAKVKNENRIKYFEEKITLGFGGNLSKRKAIQIGFHWEKKSFQILFIIERSQLVQSTLNLN